MAPHPQPRQSEMNLRALVTGASGFVGRILSAHLESHGWKVVRCGYPESDGVVTFDVTDSAQTEAVLNNAGSLTHIFHLAAVTFIPQANRDPLATMNINLQGTIRLAAALHQSHPEARLVYVGSGDSYGIPTSLPVSEEHPLNPTNPYAMSKATADLYCRFLSEVMGQNIVRVRPFNHSGPGQSDLFVLSNFARQIAEIEAGLKPPVIHVGNLEARRDFSHVNDVVRAYERIATNGRSGEVYNVCFGQSQRIQDALDALIRLSDSQIKVEIDPERFRLFDVSEVVGSHEKLYADTGWKPKITFDRLLADILEGWRANLSACNPRS